MEIVKGVLTTVKNTKGNLVMENYTVKLMSNTPAGQLDRIVAELDIEDCKAGPTETARHYEKHARLFMRHLRFDYAIAEKMTTGV